ncbi:dihydrofolate reductase family protein [Bacillus sp. NEB1478]|uniref:dihydrofolate reductase family protein n=1 Tax=Bacillus sp. NEB1478 TaxID=3073816 RepID=UPI002872DB66|nr:dihydrofolate reductase family protein [Bacillus sp. NEB1478]WNB91206.1 dihydrofolate reductase family protein [Bacillus sp. NEB1478]
MRKVVLFIAASLDGFIARENGEIDWLIESEGGEGDNGFKEFYDSISTVIMGNSTYKHILVLSEHFPYANKEVYVFTSKSQEINPPEFQYYSGSASKLINELRKKDQPGDIWLVGGANLAETFFKENLIDELILTYIPVVLGRGISLFNEHTPEKSLNLKSVKTFNQFVTLHYDFQNK